jgi:hypothetical protein
VDEEPAVRLRYHHVERDLPHADRHGSRGVGAQPVPADAERGRHHGPDRPRGVPRRAGALRDPRRAAFAGPLGRASDPRAAALRDRDAAAARELPLGRVRDTTASLPCRPRLRAARAAAPLVPAGRTA